VQTHTKNQNLHYNITHVITPRHQQCKVLRQCSVHFNDVINCVCSGVAGNMSIAELRTFPRRGDSPLEGVGVNKQRATYFWHPVSSLKLIGRVSK